MSDEEVIQELKSRKLSMSMCLDIESCRRSNNAIDFAIKCIEENKKLKEENERLIELMPKICETCKYEYELGYEEPCVSCKNTGNWKLKGVI